MWRVLQRKCFKCLCSIFIRNVGCGPFSNLAVNIGTRKTSYQWVKRENSEWEHHRTNYRLRNSLKKPLILWESISEITEKWLRNFATGPRKVRFTIPILQEATLVTEFPPFFSAKLEILLRLLFKTIWQVFWYVTYFQSNVTWSCTPTENSTLETFMMQPTEFASFSVLLCCFRIGGRT